MTDIDQIEEIAKLICGSSSNKGNCTTCGYHRDCTNFVAARAIFNADFRKASEVSKQTAEEIRQLLKKEAKYSWTRAIDYVYEEIGERYKVREK